MSRTARTLARPSTVRTHELRTMSINATATTCEYSDKSLRHEPELRTKTSGDTDSGGGVGKEVGASVGARVGPP